MAQCLPSARHSDELKILNSMISLDDFQVLPFNKKCDFITVFADYLLYRVEEERKFYLYSMKDYFVEVCYLPQEGRVLGINAFHDVQDLEEYYDFIDISDLGL